MTHGHDKFELDAACTECGELVGFFDAGDTGPDGTAAMGWRDFVVQERSFKYGSTIDVFHEECRPATKVELAVMKLKQYHADNLATTSIGSTSGADDAAFLYELMELLNLTVE